MAESIIDRLNKISGGLGSSAVPGSNRAFLESLNPYDPFGKNFRANLAKARAVPTAGRFQGAETIGGQVLQGLGNLGLLGTDAIVKGSGYVAAPLAAVIDTLGEPTYQKYIDEQIAPQLRAIDTEAARYRGLAELDKTTPRRITSGSTIAGGPTYQQDQVGMDEASARAQGLAAAQDMGELSIMPDGSMSPGNIFGDIARLTSDPYAIQQKLGESIDLEAFGFGGQQPTAKELLERTGEDITAGQPPVAEEAPSTSGEAQAAETSTTAQVSDDPLLTTGTAPSGTEQVDDAVDYDTVSQFADEDAGSNIYADLMKTSTNSVLEALGKAPEGAKSIADYKKIFSEATGIDVSGQPDNSAALTAFGLALMQNKAGKGFNVGKILSETGAAGEKALPLMVQAKKDAKASQIAAGQFALTQQSKDAATRTAFIKDQVNYLRDRRDKINDDMVARINATEDIRLKAKLKAEGDYQNHLYNRQIKLLELNNKAAKGQFKTGDKTTFKPITGMDNLTLTMGVRESDGQPVYKFPAEEAARFGVALADVNDGLRSLDDMSALISNVANQPGGVTGQKAIEVLNGWSRSLGFDNIYYDPDAKSATPLADADAIKKRVIAQYKRFLSQETGNGISEGDVTRLENALGDVNWFDNPDVAMQRIEETRAIFMGRKSQLMNEIEGFDDRDLYLSDKQYNKTMSSLASDIDAAYYYDRTGGSGRSSMMSEIFDVTEDENGIMTYRLKGS